ncbi:MAG: NupC/NupG family nucleoside CNT transporter [Bacteroidetes bacterium]|nr:NupC/NupG family nucleoside CNT transporter [Bacteroidota bacterium]
MIESIGRGFLGILLIVGIAVLFSRHRSRISWPLVLKGLTIQLIFGILVIKGGALGAIWAPLGWPKLGFDFISRAFVRLLSFTTEGAVFIFGDLALSPGQPASIGFFFAFQVLPTIIFFASLMSVMYYLGIMQKVVQGMAWIMVKILGTSGAESLSNTANIFVGQTEAPLMIRPFLKDLTESELLTVMVGGLATIAGGVMAAYVQMLGFAYAELHGMTITDAQVRFAAQLLGASIMAAPAGMVLSKILLPETGKPVTLGHVHVPKEKNASNLIDAAAGGASDGLQLALNIAAMLLAFIALIALSNFLLGLVGRIGDLNGFLNETFGKPLSLELLFGLVLQYIAFGIGFPWAESFQVGSLMGTKLVLNEFVAYLEMSEMLKTGALYSDKAVTMAAFALCGFANFSSIAILMGGLGPLAPSRRKDISRLGLRALLGGTLATMMTAAIAGILTGF